MGLAVGVEKLAGAGLLGAGGRAEVATRPSGRRRAATARSPPSTAASAPTRCPACSRRSAWSTATSTAAPASSCSPRSARRTTRHSTLNPLAAYTKKMSLEEIMGDMMIAYPNTRPMCSANCDGAAAAVVVTGAKLKTLSLEQQRRAVKVSRVGAHQRPVARGLPGPPRRQHAHPQCREAGVRAGRRRPRGPRPRRAARLLRHRRARALRQPHAVPARAAPSTSSNRARRGATARRRSTCPAACESKGHPIAATGIANIWEVCHHLRGEAGDRQIEGARVGLAHVIGLGERLRRAHPGADRGVAEAARCTPS